MYCIITPLFGLAGKKPSLNVANFTLLVLSSVFIAAAGYIINDYFDVNIDRVNKPEKLIIQRYIRRRSAIVWHFFLSMTGITIGFYLDLTTRVTLVGFSNLACASLLFIYSLSLKKKLLSGNVLIALLTAWVVLVVTWCEARFFFQSQPPVNTARILRFTFLYAGFAFVMSLIREAVKDIEDVEGDRRYNCHTMPIAWGIYASKVYVGVWLSVVIIGIASLCVYTLLIHWWLLAVYCVVCILLPSIYLMYSLFKAKQPAQFHALSTGIKAVMLTGILSMAFFVMYY